LETQACFHWSGFECSLIAIKSLARVAGLFYLPLKRPLWDITGKRRPLYLLIVDKELENIHQKLIFLIS
jgi:hypothetical protein